MAEGGQGPSVLVSRRWPAEAEEALSARFDTTFHAASTPMSQGDLAAAMKQFDVLCVTGSDLIDADMLASGGRVKLIANYGVGFDHIDIAAARARGIAVTNTPGVLTDATADIAMMLILMAARRAGEAERELRAGRWQGWRPGQLVGSALKGKVLGLVGLGRIGAATASRAHHGFGMKIAYHSRRPAEAEIARALDAEFHASLPDLLRQSDFVSVHVPGGTETAKLIDEQAIAAMKPAAYLINTARGSVVDHDALAAALREGRIAGAGLDVYPEEPNVPPALLEQENAVLLPHIGSADHETRIAMGMRVLANVEAWAAGAPLPDRVA